MYYTSLLHFLLLILITQRARPQIASMPKTSFIFLTECEAYLGNYWLTCFLNQFENGFFECVNKTLKVKSKEGFDS